jgi:hypothetical protein
LRIRSSVVRDRVKKCLLRAADVSLLVSKGEEAAMQTRKFDGNEVACLDRTRNHQPGYHGDPGASLDCGANGFVRWEHERDVEILAR